LVQILGSQAKDQQQQCTAEKTGEQKTQAQQHEQGSRRLG
jgi:hypothetical protein